MVCGPAYYGAAETGVELCHELVASSQDLLYM